MRFERGVEKIKIERKRKNENNNEELIKERTKDIIEIMRKIKIKKRKVLKTELPNWLQDCLKERDEQIEINKIEIGRDFYLHFGDSNVAKDTIIRLHVKNIEKDPTAQIVVKKGKKEKRFFLKGERAEEIIKQAGFLGMVKDREKRWVILKKGDRHKGFTHIIMNHFSSFRTKAKIEEKEKIIDLVLSGIRKAQKIKFDRKRQMRIYRYQIEKGKVLRIVVDDISSQVITAYIEK